MNPCEKLQPPDREKIKQQLSAATFQLRTYTIKTVTPMFGGGVEAGVVDTEMPVRATAIRGHLRFWWRVLYGVQYQDAKSLFEAEKELWGSTAMKSPVEIGVEILQPGEKRACGEYVKKQWTFKERLPAYALFPFKPKKDEEKKEIIPDKAYYLEDIRFKLTLIMPNDWEEKQINEVEGTIWAWINFGGLGARTRRGCGALYCEPLSPKENDIGTKKHYEAWINKNFPWDRKKISVYVLSKLSDKNKNAGETWTELVKKYSSFRRQNKHKKDTLKKDHPKFSDFPCAIMGMPIVFQPDKQTLVPIKKDRMERMASPLIIKPLSITRDNNVEIFLPLCLIFPTPDIDGLHLSSKSEDIKGSFDKINNKLAAFKNKLKGEKYDEVSL